MAFKTPPIDLSKTQVRRSRIYQIGIELEGGWDKIPGEATIIRDGSVVTPGRYVGELPSPPLLLGELPKWLKTYYPQHVNDTCGMHVHLSFNNNAFLYQQLMTEAYPATIVAEMKKWATIYLSEAHHIWPRLLDQNRYCRHRYYADQQAFTQNKDHSQTRLGNRYTVVNYCWGRQRTVECRLLPMMDTSDKAYEIIQELINITEKFLCATAKRSTVVVPCPVADYPAIEVNEVRI